jgi:oxygen-dependent protoporphyrinogen oxidase
MSAPHANVAIIGGGISGLAAAYRTTELLPTARLQVFEAANRPGGVLQTIHSGPYLVEQSADNFLSNLPWGVGLCKRLGLEGELLSTDESRRQAFIVHRGKLQPVPQGFLLMAPTQLTSLLTTPLVSWRGKLRMLGEWFVPPHKDAPDETLGSFVRRRWGREVFDRIVQPLVGGIYTADPEQLSLCATLPRFLEMERTHGSLLRAMLRGKTGSTADSQASGARYGMFVAPRGGMSQLVDTLVKQLPADTLILRTAVEQVGRTPQGKWQLVLHNLADDTRRSETFDALIMATPAPQAAKLLSPIDSQLSADLASIPYAGTSIVVLSYARADVRHPLDGFGLVVPAVENRQILAASFASNKFPGRAPNDEVLIRVFIGGACQPELADLPDSKLRAIAVAELSELLGITAEPVYSQITRWPRAMPQYHLGHMELVERIEQQARTHPNLALCGNAYRGVGIPNCIHQGELAAEVISTMLNDTISSTRQS